MMTTTIIKPLFALMLMAHTCLAQQKAVLNVAIMVYNGAEVLDFGGPAEVFGATQGFKAYTVSIDGKPITSQGFVRVQPNYSIADAPQPDIIVFPGGGVGAVTRSEAAMAWVQQHHSRGGFLLSVCTGAYILAKAGLLQGLNVTTWHGYVDELQQEFPGCKVLRDTRFVDNGQIVTTAGVSAGIDGALHVVARIKGTDVAKAVARYMEYDKWHPEEGRIDYTHPIVAKLRQHRRSPTAFANAIAELKGSGNKCPYMGELRNLLAELHKEKLQETAALLAQAITQLYASYAPNWEALRQAYIATGKPAPRAQDAYLQMLRDGKVTEAIALLRDDQQQFGSWLLCDEEAVNQVGYSYLQQKKLMLAIAVFELNTELYPQSANVYDSLGEAYMAAGNKSKAIENYNKSLALNPNSTNAVNALAKLEKE